MTPMVDAATKLLSSDDLYRMPRAAGRFELCRGELVQMAPVGYRHGRHVSKLHARLETYVGERAIGACSTEVGFILASDPDTAFIRRERVEVVGEPVGYWRGAPDLAVEIVSPGGPFRSQVDSPVSVPSPQPWGCTELRTKIDEYLRAGAPLVLVVYLRPRRVTVHRAEGTSADLFADGALDGEDVVPGFVYPLAELFGP